jgi:F420-0:gamma-glutamyl ligase
MVKEKEPFLSEDAVLWINEKIVSTAGGQVTIYIEDKNIASIRFLSSENFNDSVTFKK